MCIWHASRVSFLNISTWDDPPNFKCYCRFPCQSLRNQSGMKVPILQWVPVKWTKDMCQGGFTIADTIVPCKFLQVVSDFLRFFNCNPGTLQFTAKYFPLVNVYITLKHHHVYGKLAISLVIFNSKLFVITISDKSNPSSECIPHAS